MAGYSNASIKNIKDYSDNIIRYFSLTMLLKKRGNGYYIDIVPSRIKYINALLQIDNGASNNFESKKDYLDYLWDITYPKIEIDNIELKNEYINEITELINKNNFHLEELNTLNNYDLKQLINLKKKILFKLEKDLYYNNAGITEIINSLENIRKLEISPALALEKWVSTALIVLNDAQEIKPNFSADDDNNIIFTAPSGKPDIECFYEEFNSICEVTMLTGRDQWYNEGQPVMRHFSDFIKETKPDNKDSYCLFVAPRIHRDTLNTFWYSLKYEYEGLKLKIIPLSLRRFEEVMYVLRKLEQNNLSFSRNDIKDLFDLICNVNEINSSSEWWTHINEAFASWKTKLIENV